MIGDKINVVSGDRSWDFETHSHRPLRRDDDLYRFCMTAGISPTAPSRLGDQTVPVIDGEIDIRPPSLGAEIWWSIRRWLMRHYL
jgi:hypothetical protein